jgi:hypothetical protein
MTTIAPRRVAVPLLALVLTVLGCETNKSRTPTSPSVAGPIAGVTITAPKGLEPASGTQVVSDQQPLNLLIENPTTSGERKVWLEIEVSTTTAFDALVHKATNVEPGPNGRTTYRLPEALPAEKTYHWRVRGLDGANTGAWSTPISFDIVAAVVLETPLPLSPVSGQVLANNAPELIVSNGRVSNTSNVTYRFEVSTSANLETLSAVITVPRSGESTTRVSLGTVPYDTTFYWRVSASDGVRTTPYSNVHAFRTAPAPKTTTTTTSVRTTTTVPGGTTTTVPPGGNRTPNPPPGQRLPLPNMFSVVQEIADQYPGALRNSCQDHGGTWEFMDRVVDRLRQIDTRWGYNCKRGNCNDPSLDVIDYNYSSDRDEGTTNVYIIDIIGGHCGSNPVPVWNDVTGVTASQGTIGRWTGRGRF